MMAPPRPRKSRLVWRVYAFTAALAIAIMAALLVLPRYTRSARYMEPQAALMQFLVERWSTKDFAGFSDAVTRIEPRLRGGLTLFAADGHMLRTIDVALDPPSDAERRTLATEKWTLDWGRIVVRSDDGSLIGVYAPTRPGFP